MHSQSALTELSSPNLAPFILLNHVFSLWFRQRFMPACRLDETTNPLVPYLALFSRTWLSSSQIGTPIFPPSFSCIMLSDSDEAGCTNPLIKSLPSLPTTPLLSQARKPFPAAALSHFCLMNAFSDRCSDNWFKDAKILQIKNSKCTLRLFKLIFLYCWWLAAHG